MKKRFVIVPIVGLALLAALQFLPIAAMRTPTMMSRVLDGDLYFFEPADSASVSILAKGLAETRTAILSALGGGGEAPVKVYVYDSNATYRVMAFGGIVGPFLPTWMDGCARGNAILLTSPAHPGPSHTRDSIIVSFVHEYVHVLTDRINPEIGIWLHEGLACYLAKQEGGADPAVISGLSYAEASRLDSLRFAKLGGYQLAPLYVSYLVKTYGMPRIVELVRSGEDYRHILGADAEDLFSAWKKYIGAY